MTGISSHLGLLCQFVEGRGYYFDIVVNVMSEGSLASPTPSRGEGSR